MARNKVTQSRSILTSVPLAFPSRPFSSHQQTRILNSVRQEYRGDITLSYCTVPQVSVPRSAMPPIPIHPIPARSGVALKLKEGETIKVINTHGKQVIDFWALNASDPSESLSMAHTHGTICKLIPSVGDTFYSNMSQPMMTLSEDTTPGAHDTLVSACDAGRYKLLGVEGYHPSCTDNYSIALRRSGLVGEDVSSRVPPPPLNLFMDVPISEGGVLEFTVPTSEAGQFVCLKMMMDVIVIMSACPMDLRATNNWKPTDCHYTISGQ